MKMIKIFTAIAFVGFMSSANAQDEIALNTTEKSVVEMPKSLENANTIVGVAASNENFTTLVTAVKAAELVDTLNSEGPFTVFAPTNDAFSKLPAGTVESLLKPESKAVLTSILTYHVVAGNFDAASVIAAVTENGGKFTVNTVQGGEIIISLNDGKVMLTDEKGNSSTVVMADVEASNGVIHAIDAVVMPE